MRPFTGRLADGDIRLLRVFCKVAECGGFAAAEAELQLGLPSISRYIKDLEIRLGARLCQRGRTGFSLTDQGVTLHHAALRFLRNIEQFEAEIRAMHAELNGTLDVGMADTLITDPQFQLSKVLSAFKRDHPAVVLNLSIATSKDIEQRIINGDLGAGIVVSRRHISSLSYIKIYEECCSLYCTSEHPLAVRRELLTDRDLFNYDYVGYTYADDNGRELRSGAGTLTPMARVDHSEALATLIATGAFFGYLPDHYVSSMRFCSNFVKILDHLSFPSSVELAVRTRDNSLQLRAFTALFQELWPVTR